MTSFSMGLKIPTLQYFSSSIFCTQRGQIFKKIVLSLIIGNFLTQNNRKTRIPRWFGRENEENVVRSRDWCGMPSSPRPPHGHYLSLENLKLRRHYKIGNIISCSISNNNNIMFLSTEISWNFVNRFFCMGLRWVGEQRLFWLKIT